MAELSGAVPSALMPTFWANVSVVNKNSETKSTLVFFIRFNLKVIQKKCRLHRSS
jgi:hypothetical protein